MSPMAMFEQNARRVAGTFAVQPACFGSACRRVHVCFLSHSKQSVPPYPFATTCLPSWQGKCRTRVALPPVSVPWTRLQNFRHRSVNRCALLCRDVRISTCHFNFIAKQRSTAVSLELLAWVTTFNAQ